MICLKNEIILCETDNKNSGIVWVAKDTDDLSKNYPSILYEFIGNNSIKKYYLGFAQQTKNITNSTCRAWFMV
jgi:hypothetical protein